MTAYAIWPDDSERGKAGFGPISDGVPRSVGRHGHSLDDMPDPPRRSRFCGRDIGEDDTHRIRRPR